MKFLTVFILSINCYLVFSQDIHWSQINSNPLFQNPGNCGLFKEDHRFSFNLKDQWRTVTKPYTSTSIGYDTKYRYYPKLGLGSILVSDVAGDGTFKTLEMKAIGSYELFNSKNMHSLRLGIDLGLNYREQNFNAYMYDNQYNGYFSDNSIQTVENNKSSNTINYSVSLGGVWTKRINGSNLIKIGVSSFNLNKPNHSFYGIKVQRDIRNLIHIQYQQKIYKQMMFIPSINISKQGKYTEILIGALINQQLEFNDIQNFILVYGLYYRSMDALIVTLGTNIKNKYLIGTSYDINISQFTKATNGRGSIELSFIYLLNRKLIHKPKQIQCIEYL